MCTPARHSGRSGGRIVIRDAFTQQQRGSSSRAPPPRTPKKVKTEYEALTKAQEMLFDPAADPNGRPGLAVVLQESMNDILPLDEAKACAWSLQITGMSFLDLTADDRKAGPSGVVKNEPTAPARRSRPSRWTTSSPSAADVAVRLDLGLVFQISFKSAKFSNV